MILLDTNVVSEAMKPEPFPAVRRWLDEQAAETLYLSSVTIAELMFGVGALPDANARIGWPPRAKACWSCSQTASCHSI
jgi:predicted nucleic acid-binding protein